MKIKNEEIDGMKKLLSILLVLIVSFSILTVSADNVTLRSPVQCDLVLGSDSYVTAVKDANGVITGRTIDASKASSTTIASVAGGTFKIRPVNVAEDGTYTFGGSTAQIKTSFVWQFDFSFAGDIPNSIDKFRLQFSSKWNNKLYFVSLDDTHYYIQWSSTPDGYVNEMNKSTLESKYVLEEGKTYRMKIEVNLETDKVYVTFVNPYVDADGNVNAEPNWNNAYTRTTTGKNASLGFSLPTAADVKNTNNRFPITFQDLTNKVQITTSNETFYMDRIHVVAPELSVEANSVKATANAINIPDYGYYGKLPTLFCAVYKDNKLVDFEMNSPYVNGLRALTDSKYSAVVEGLEDGTYKVKAFVWNSVDKMLSYDNCSVEKTLTVADGVAKLSE